MADLFDYLTWRGDLSLRQVPFGPVDALVLSILSYIPFGSLVSEEIEGSVTLEWAARSYLAQPVDCGGRIQCGEDRRLLGLLAGSTRFSRLRLACAAERFAPEEESQFAALAVLLADGSAFLSFRGTDATLVGWKEDFNMSFLDIVPAQRAAAEYTGRFAARFSGPLLLGGHSKGGNLAVCAAALCQARDRDRIRAVYSFDGPGFTPYLLSQPGYWELLTRLHAYVPQSSVVGMLLEHGEGHTVVRSDRTGLLQHDPYSWQIQGGDFLRLDQVSPGSKRLDRVLKDWLAGLSPDQREKAVDTLFRALSAFQRK